MPRSIFRTLLAALLLLGMSTHLSAQIFKLQGGASNFYGADGGSVQFKSSHYDGQMGLGFVNGAFHFGGLVHTKIMGNTLTVGDDNVRFDLPVDVFGSSHFFLGRGVGLLHPYTQGTAYVFLGTTSEGFMTPFFTAARSADRVAALYLDHKITPRLRFISRNLMSQRSSSIQAIEWTAQPGVHLSAAAGMGSNQGYGAAAVDVDRLNFKLKAAFIAEGKQFERVRTPNMLTSELERENISFAYRPVKGFTVSASHQNILQPPYAGQEVIRAGTDSASATFNVAQFNFGGGLYRNRIGEHATLGSNLFAGRQLTRRLNVAGNLFNTRPDAGAASQIYTGTTRFVLSPRLSVTGVVIRNGQQTSFGAGGELTGNRLSLNVSSQTVYLPLRLDRPFQQSLSVNASAYLVGDLRVTIASMVAPDGRLRYTFGLSRFLYRQEGMGGPSGPSFRFAKFVVLGLVVDAAEQPVEGAAVHIAGQVAYSDAAGRFMVRLNKRGPYPLLVAPDEFIAPGLWEAVTAPSSAMGEKEETAAPLRIVVRRVPATVPNPK